MNIDIVQVDKELRFLKSDFKIYYGRNSRLLIKKRKYLFNSNGDKITEIKLKIGLREIKFIISFYNNPRVVYLKLKGGLLKNYFICHYRENVYKVIQHKGQVTSFFKDDQQIGYYRKKNISILESQRMTLISNSDIDQKLIFSFILALELSAQEQDEYVSVNFGNFSQEYLPFNNGWEPTN